MSHKLINLRNPPLPKGWEYGSDAENLMGCPYCRSVQTMEDFDCMGLDDLAQEIPGRHRMYDPMQCLSCGRIVIPFDVRRVKENLPLFGDSA